MRKISTCCIDVDPTAGDSGSNNYQFFHLILAGYSALWQISEPENAKADKIVCAPTDISFARSNLDSPSEYKATTSKMMPSESFSTEVSEPMVAPLLDAAMHSLVASSTVRDSDARILQLQSFVSFSQLQLRKYKSWAQDISGALHVLAVVLRAEPHSDRDDAINQEMLRAVGDNTVEEATTSNENSYSSSSSLFSARTSLNSDISTVELPSFLQSRPSTDNDASSSIMRPVMIRKSLDGLNFPSSPIALTVSPTSSKRRYQAENNVRKKRATV
jgi:hypothetical protein